MKDFLSIWNSLVDQTYDAVNKSEPKAHSGKTPAEAALSAIQKSTHKHAIIFAFVGIVGIFSGFFILLVKPYDMIFNWKTLFTDGGEIFEMWRNPEVNLYLRVYLWNVTNKEEFLSGIDDKLKVEEVGPYVYRELMSHDNITFNDNGTMNAIPKHPLVWVPELSEGRREDDLLILPNIALLSIADVVADKSYFTRFGLNMLILRTGSEPLVQMTAREFMFGYKNILMTLGNNFMPSWIYFDKLGLIDRMYDFNGDYETVYTGEKDPGKSGLLDTYSGSRKMPQWEYPCGDVHGASDGSKFPANIQPDDKLLFFRKSMCRSKYLVRVNETYSSGMYGYVYNFAPDSDDNGKVNKNNTCFCKNPDKCLPPGLLDVRGCYYGFPIALSNPHFLDTDPVALERIDPSGIKPDPDLHKSYFVIQPKSGLPLELAGRFQINMALGNIKKISKVERFDNMVLPLLWAEMRLYDLPPGMALKFQFYIKIMPIVEEILKYLSFVMGTFCIAYSMYRFIKFRYNPPMYHNGMWIEEEFSNVDIEKKLSKYLPEKRASMTAKDLEFYIDSLVAPLNQEISFEEFQEMKEEIV